MSFRITSVSAYITIDGDDEEGIIGSLGANGTWVPFIAADHARLESLRPQAQEIARALNKEVTLVRFSVREEVEVLRP